MHVSARGCVGSENGIRMKNVSGGLETTQCGCFGVCGVWFFFHHPIEKSRFVDTVYTYFIQGQVVMFTFSYPSQN